MCLGDRCREHEYTMWDEGLSWAWGWWAEEMGQYGWLERDGGEKNGQRKDRAERSRAGTGRCPSGSLQVAHSQLGPRRGPIWVWVWHGDRVKLMLELGLEKRSGNSPEVRDIGWGYNRQRHRDSLSLLTLELSVTFRVNNSICFKQKTIKMNTQYDMYQYIKVNYSIYHC